MQKIKKYSKKEEYSYTLGAFPTWELVNNRSEDIVVVFIDENFSDKEKLIETLVIKKIKYEISSKAISKLSTKENVFVIGVFKKNFNEELNVGNHLMLNEVSDMGNLGTIIRSMLAFGIRDLALVGNVCDIYNPKVVRASMGAIFNIRFKHYNQIEDYLKEFGNNLYMFMLSNDERDSIYHKKIKSPYTLVMGNEATGLPKEFERYGEKTFIPQSEHVDSLNLTIATSIGLYEFRRKDETNSI